MQLQYLDFDFSDEDSGRGSFDAMASVLPGRVPALLAEVAAVLRWAQQAFGPPAALDEGGEWDFELQALAEPDTPLDIAFEAGRGEVLLADGAGDARCTLTLTLGGSPDFCAALRESFAMG